MLCTGLVGCMNWDKSKDTKATGQVKTGLPGTPKLQPNDGTASRTGQPGAGQFAGPGANLQQPGFATAGNSGGFRPGTNGLNTNTAGQQNWNQPWNNQPPGTPGMIGSPTPPGGISVQPAGGGVGAAPYQNTGGVSTAGYPPAPSLPLDGPLPPPAPPLGGSHGGDFAGAAGQVQPPVPPGAGPLAPPLTPPTTPAGGAAPTYQGKGGF
jgi:hypothetical protein